MDIDAGERAVERIRPLVASTLRPEVLGGLGDFGGLFALDTDRYRAPVLVACTDGVGTKAVVARDAGRFDTIGIDLVAMCVDDLVCQGAEPLFFLDYISTGAVDPDQMAALVAGVADGCRQVGAALLGGEMAEHAGIMARASSTWSASPSGWWSATPSSGSERVRDGRRADRAGLPGPAVPTATAWPARCCLERAGLRPGRPGLGRGPTPRWPTSCCCPRCSTPRRSGPPWRRPRSTPWPTSPVVASPATSPGRCPTASGRCSTPGAGRCPGSSPRCAGWAGWTDAEMLKVFNLGLGMVVVAAADSAADALACPDRRTDTGRRWWAGWRPATPASSWSVTSGGTAPVADDRCRPPTSRPSAATCSTTRYGPATSC